MAWRERKEVKVEKGRRNGGRYGSGEEVKEVDMGGKGGGRGRGGGGGGRGGGGGGWGGGGGGGEEVGGGGGEKGEVGVEVEARWG